MAKCKSTCKTAIEFEGFQKVNQIVIVREPILRECELLELEFNAMNNTSNEKSQAKCPACGWRMDGGAYRCPNCRIYFCLICRKELGRHDEKFRCEKQSCKYHGKLVCSGCTALKPVTATREVGWFIFTKPEKYVTGHSRHCKECGEAVQFLR